MNIRKKIGKKPTQKRVLERENTQNCASLNVLEMAERTGLEPATPGVTGRYSNQLNYRSASIPALGPEPETGWGDPVMQLKVVGGTGIEPVTLAL